MNIGKTLPSEAEIKLYTILLVDDSPVNLGVVVESLERNGFDVLVALDGEEALQRVAIAMPDLILLDVMMPGLDGFEICRRLKALARTRDIPVIFMTSLGGIEDKVKGFAAGAVDYVTKPLQIEEVRARVNLHLKLHALQQRLEKKNVRLQQEIAERERAELSLHKSFDQIAELNGCLNAQMVQLEATQELLEQTETWYRDILHSAPDGMLVVDGEGIIVQVNARTEILFGYAESELLGNSIEMLLPSVARKIHENKRAAFAASASSERPMSGMVIGYGCRKDGSQFSVDVSLSSLQSRDGAGVMFCTAVREVGIARA